MEKQFEKGKTIKTADGTVMVMFDGKLHNWDGPALIPQGNKRLAEYYLFGIKHTKEQWEEKKQYYHLLLSFSLLLTLFFILKVILLHKYRVLR